MCTTHGLERDSVNTPHMDDPWDLTVGNTVGAIPYRRGYRSVPTGVRSDFGWGFAAKSLRRHLCANDYRISIHT